MTGPQKQLIRTDEPWMERAECAKAPDPDIFFATGESGASRLQERQARSFCRKCDVASECWDFAKRSGERFGIWSGVNVERDRRAVS